MQEPSDEADAPKSGTLGHVLNALRKIVLLIVVAGAGATIASSLAPPISVQVGPLDLATRTSVTVPFEQRSTTRIDLPPVGSIGFDTHSGPLGVELSVNSIDLDAARELIASPREISQLPTEAAIDLRSAVIKSVVVSLGCLALGGFVAGALVYRRGRRALECAAIALAPGLLAAGLAAATFDGSQFEQPRFTGLLSRAPYVVGATRSTADRLEGYRNGIDEMARSVTAVYATANQLPAMPTQTKGVTTVLHVSDIHLNPQAFDLIASTVKQFGVKAVLDTGDITSWGSDLESRTLAPIGKLGVPYVFVRGNHDSPATENAIRQQKNALVLENSVREVAGLRIAGIGDYDFTPDGTGNSREKAARAATDLAHTITTSAREGKRVDVAMIHNPTRVAPLLGSTPLILSGHMHTRAVRVDQTGTRLMVEGSTGGAGFTSGGMLNLQTGKPIPLDATLLYFAKNDDGTQRLIAYDEISVGGLGLASVSVQRTVIDPEAPTKVDDSPLPDVTPADRTPTQTATATVPGTVPSSLPSSLPSSRQP